jgi:proteasome accessory factor C
MVSLVSYLAASGVREPLGQLAERFDVSAATVKEDLMLLWTEVGAGPWGGQVLDFDWSEDFSEVALLDSQGLERPVRLSPVEAITLITALRSLEQAAGVHEAAAAQTARAKLEAALGPVDVAEVALPAGGPALQGLREAIDQKTRVAFEYVDGRGGSTQRQVDPLGLFTASDHWLLAAWDLGANAERYFRVDRITQLELLPHPATAHPYQPHPSGWSGDADMLVDVIFAASERWRAEELETPLPPLELPGGSLQIRLAVSGAEWVTRLALSGGGAVEVLGPPDLRARIANAARAALGGGEPTSG